jgi:serine O-acetyltransferase
MKIPFSRTLNHNNWWGRWLFKLKFDLLNSFWIIQVKSNVPKSTIFPHLSGIFIAENVVMGENCRIYQGVTIGSKSRDCKEYPVIGNNVIFYANSVVFGNITIGNNCVVGAGSVVCKSFPDNSVIIGNPARRVK